MRQVMMSVALLAFVAVLGCGSNTTKLPDKVPPMPKGDTPAIKPDSGGSMNEK